MRTIITPIMTNKDNLQKEIKEKVKAGVKPTELKTQMKELEDYILQLRLDKIKEFGEYYETKQELETELELNINAGIKEIQRLEKKLLTVNKKKLELQSQLGQAHSKHAQL